MRIAHFEKVISPEVGVTLAGYGAKDVAKRLHDDLKLSVLLMDDGKKKGAILSFDLIGLDEQFILKISQDAAAVIACEPENVILTCTHTHSGPHTRTAYTYGANLEYMEKLFSWVREAVTAAMDKWQEVDTYFYSCQCDENYNRRYTDGANNGKYLPMNRSFEPLATGFKDQELGLLIFTGVGSWEPEGVLVNFAAHPLASHSMGLGSHQISADFPGVLRDVLAENSCWSVFLQGAAGDQFPKDAECGFEAARRCANGVAIEVMRGLCDAPRNPDLYKIENPEIRTSIVKVPVAIRHDKASIGHQYPYLAGRDEVELRLHLFAVGDVCLVGVPGELFGELGQEIKWHSPFRRTFILYNSTAYISYICNANAFVSGGYETGSSQLQPYEGLKLVVAAVEGMRKIHAPFPEELTFLFTEKEK
ncbi:MAG: hypothetical protein IKC94_01515 [Lentisphaeria bacterium]|nr:hypothetical protein [Lentisphaeria bacterium]